MRRQGEKSSHNFLHNIIVTFSHCVLSERQQKSFLLARRVIATFLVYIALVDPHPPPRLLPHEHRIKFIPSPLSMRCSSSSFFMPAFFRVFYKFYRHHHENCRRILMWNLNLIHIMANFFLYLVLKSFAGKQQHFRPITHSRLHQLHDFRFRYDIGTHPAQESRVELREMGGRIAN